jgi:hypothetical protein
VRLKNGKEFAAVIENPKGSRDNPLTHEELVFKFNDCLDSSIMDYGKEIRSKLIQAMVSTLKAPDICEIIGLINGASTLK